MISSVDGKESVKKAVWSLWAKPILEQPATRWRNAYYFFLGWVLSVTVSRAHFLKVELCTDYLGAYLLCDVLGLEFDEVSIFPDTLDGVDEGWWAAGKLMAYSMQNEPFVHLDQDVILWKPIPRQLERLDVIGQSPELFRKSDRATCYKIAEFEQAVALQGSKLPKEWHEYSQSGNYYLEAVCCAVFGGCNVAFIQRYAQRALVMIGESGRDSFWKNWGYDDPNVLTEQFYLGACIASAKKHRSFGDEFRSGYLFENPADPYFGSIAEKAGYTHLIGNSKVNLTILENVEKCVTRLDPSARERCVSASLALKNCAKYR